MSKYQSKSFYDKESDVVAQVITLGLAGHGESAEQKAVSYANENELTIESASREGDGPLQVIFKKE